MYSYEIDNILKEHGYNISASLYLNIFDIKATPQIIEIKYNAWNNDFYVRTKDGYEWTFKVKRED